MSDPLRTDSPREPHAATEAERDAKIEQLLLAGLDHYFAGQYDHAINVWTRALFLDRSHARARAYIERARSALAEKQRQSEELLQSGVAAFERGEGDEARRLIEQAIVHGAPSDEALAVLDRLNRLEHGQAVAAPSSARADRTSAARAVTRAPLSRGAVIAAAVVLAVGASIYIAVASRSTWRRLIELPDPVAAGTTTPTLADTPLPLPLPRRGAIAVDRARRLMIGGRLRDALTTLDQVRPTDPEKADADQLRAEIQKQLLGLAVLPPPPPPHPTASEGRHR
jgi:tetratricopeptide (TPR) repeat protein